MVIFPRKPVIPAIFCYKKHNKDVLWCINFYPQLIVLLTEKIILLKISPMDKFVALAKKAVEAFIKKGEIIKPSFPLLKEFNRRAGVFVSIHKISSAFASRASKERISSFHYEFTEEHPSEIYNGYQPPLRKKDLQGCVGTYQPAQKNIALEIIHNAIESATRDPRFAPITIGELPQLRYSIDILSSPETVSKNSDLEPKRYGLIVSTGDGRRGLLLPDLPGVETIKQQIQICKTKAGIDPSERVTLQRFTVERHKEKWLNSD